jgi:8-oxo-dGTP diphosphatase
VAWLAVLPDGVDPTAGSDAAHAEWKPVDYLRARRRLAFDHAAILGCAVERARSRLESNGLAAQFLGEEFTIGELRRVYEVMWAVQLDPGNFHRKVTRTSGFVEPTGRVVAGGRGRPAELFRYAGADVLHPPLTRGSLG